MVGRIIVFGVENKSGIFVVTLVMIVAFPLLILILRVAIIVSFLLSFLDGFAFFDFI